MSIRPEQSHNVNVSLSYTHAFGRHSVYAEAGFVYRNTDDYIQRNIASLSGGKYAATYVNYGNVLTRGLNLSARYGYGRLLSVGGNFTSMKVTDNMKTAMGSQTANINYKERMSNLPYLFSDCDVNLYWHDLGAKGNVLTLTYDNQFLHSFTYYSSRIGANKGDYVVPNQFSHNVTLSYSLKNGRYTLSAECQNLTDEKLYDNFSLQKAGRAFYGKIRVHFGK
jgi:outer membrane receptor protein involved in Fe transport